MYLTLVCWTVSVKIVRYPGDLYYLQPKRISENRRFQSLKPNVRQTLAPGYFRRNTSTICAHNRIYWLEKLFSTTQRVALGKTSRNIVVRRQMKHCHRRRSDQYTSHYTLTPWCYHILSDRTLINNATIIYGRLLRRARLCHLTVNEN